MQSTASASITFDRNAARKSVQEERRRSNMIDLTVTLATILIALLLGCLVIFFVKRDDPAKAIEAITALFTGPLTRIGRTGRWLEVATNLVIVGLSVAIAFRARQFSLGAESQILVGAMVAATIGIFVPLPPVLAIVVPTLAAMVAGFLVGLLPGVMKSYLNANEIVSTLMINAIIARLFDAILTYILKPAGAQTTQSDPVLDNAMLPRFEQLIGVDLGNFNLGVIFAILATIGVWLLLTRTRFGYEVRTIGANEKFARYGGINTKRTVALSFALGGAVAALCGVHLALGVHQRLLLAFTGGLGFDGITVALLARNNPLIVPIAGLFYAYLLVGGDRMEGVASVGSEIVQVIQAIIMFLITAQLLVQWVKQRRTKQTS
jgi:simple sugar transport system permease protein